MSKHSLVSVSEANTLIQKGGPLLFAGSETVLRELEKGSWIGGTIPYFMVKAGGTFETEKLFVTELPPSVTIASMRFYSSEDIPNVNVNGEKQGVSFIIIPYGSATHEVFAEGAPSYDGYLMHSLVGWISGVALSELENVRPKVFLGTECKSSEDDAVVTGFTHAEFGCHFSRGGWPDLAHNRVPLSVRKTCGILPARDLSFKARVRP